MVHGRAGGPERARGATLDGVGRPHDLAPQPRPIRRPGGPDPRPRRPRCRARLPSSPASWPTPTTPGAPPTVQTSPSGSGIPVATITATPVQRATEEPQGQEPEPDGARSDKELDELARDLFGRIRTQLRAEVIHEREAKGLTFDAF